MKFFRPICLGIGLGLAIVSSPASTQSVLDRQPGARLQNWDGPFLRTAGPEWLWASASPGEVELAAVVLGTPVSYTLFPGSFEMRVSNGWSRAHRIGTFWTSSALAGIHARTSKSPVPEPRIWLLVGLGAAFMLWNLRRRRHA